MTFPPAHRWSRLLKPHRTAPIAAALALSALATPTLTPAADPAVRDLVATECAHCHGQDGNAAPPSFPKLAGLQRDYLAKQLEDYASGRRSNQAMEVIVEKLNNRQIQELADYFAQQPRELGSAYLQGMVPLGARLYHKGNRERGVPSCAGCHKPDGSGTQRSPLIAGQNSAYVLAQLRAFHSGARANDNGQLMRTTADRLTEPEMVAVSEYVATMHLKPPR